MKTSEKNYPDIIKYTPPEYELGTYQFHIHMPGAVDVRSFLDDIYQFFATSGKEGVYSMKNALNEYSSTVPLFFFKKEKAACIEKELAALLSKEGWNQPYPKLRLLFEFKNAGGGGFRDGDILELCLDEDRKPEAYWRHLYFPNEQSHVSIDITSHTECNSYMGSIEFNGILDFEEYGDMYKTSITGLIADTLRRREGFNMKFFISERSKQWPQQLELVECFLNENSLEYCFI